MHVKSIKVHEGDKQRITQLEIKTVKHSFAPEGRKINVPFVMDSTQEPPVLFFDWGHATADLLTDGKKCPNLSDILHVTASTSSMTALTRTFSCKQLGLKEVSGSVLGLAIHQNDELMGQLRQALGIRIHDIWTGCMPPAISGKQELAQGEHDEATESNDSAEKLDL